MSVVLTGELALDGRLAPGWVELDGERMVHAAHGPPPRLPEERLDGILAPGLCDLQVNGAVGREVSGGEAAIDAIDALQLAHGVTSYLPTLISPDDQTAERVLPALAARAADPGSPVAGVHLEGPFLSREHAGMHPLERLRTPAEGVPSWVEHPAVRLVTLAPELPGALELTARLSERGIAVALGHSGADAEVAAAAINAGARLITHVFNGMAPLHQRAPGLAGVALADDRVHVSVIADGVHVHPLVLELVRRAVGARAVLISDATPAAGAPPGRYETAGVPIERGADGSARTADGRLAGSTLTLDQAVGTWHAMTGATLAQALFAAGQAPVAAVRLHAETPADLVQLDSAGMLRRVMRRGAWQDF
ncbi:MAG: N-acetylglucosamine-6-phosphate deacetylase [Solirubrobacteraceae bacterium]